MGDLPATTGYTDQCIATLVAANDGDLYLGIGMGALDMNAKTKELVNHVLKEGISKVAATGQDHTLVFTLAPGITIMNYYNDILKVLNDHPDINGYYTDHETHFPGAPIRVMTCNTKDGRAKLVVRFIGMTVSIDQTEQKEKSALFPTVRMTED